MLQSDVTLLLGNVEKERASGGEFMVFKTHHRGKWKDGQRKRLLYGLYGTIIGDEPGGVVAVMVKLYELEKFLRETVETIPDESPMGQSLIEARKRRAKAQP